MRWMFIRLLIYVGIPVSVFSSRLHAQGFDIDAGGEVIFGPPPAMDHATWLTVLQQWRIAKTSQMHYDGSLYARPALLWTQRNYMQPQMMVEDRYFYDPTTRQYTVDRYLDDLEKRYGGIDSVLMWPVYPNVGIDNRGQHDLLRDMPGGHAGVKKMIAEFHRRGVHVLFPMMPWDAGTRLQDMPFKDAVAHNFKDAGIDGANGDTMGAVGKEFLDACDALGHPLAFEPEGGSNPADIQYDALGWGYWKTPRLPPVDRNKWIEPRHLSNICERWSHNHINALQCALYNGDGFETWENVWGIWNGMTQRDAEATRRVGTVQRALADFFVSPDWEPMAPTLHPDDVYSSRFPRGDRTVWTLINRAKIDFDGPQIAVPFAPGISFYDVWNGKKLTPDVSGTTATLSFPIEANGFGAVIAIHGEPSPDLQKLLSRMSLLSATPLSAYSDKWTPLPQQIVEIPPTAPAATAPDGMILIPGAKYHFKVHGVEIEGGNGPGVDVQLPGESMPVRSHEHDIAIKPFYIDKFPVTNAQFKTFLDATKYHSADDHNFLRDWTNGTYPAGWANKPVTWVSIEDARTYAAWAGKRLPHEWEWQYAAQGTDGRLYPWGAKPDPSVIPPPEHGHDLRAPTDVDAYPKGASPFGVMDMTGNVWQWTDEYRDEHTRAAILRGGGYYRPSGSQWYFPSNTTLDEHGKYLLMCPGKDRAGTLGFRYAKDA